MLYRVAKNTMDTKSANEAFSSFTGTEAYHRFSLITRLLCTDGAIAVAHACGAFWLLDIIASYQPKLKKAGQDEFQSWNLNLNPSGSGAVVTCTDGNENVLITQKIPFTDFPYASLNLFVEDGIILLPSEH